jgi:hypothetical protein
MEFPALVYRCPGAHFGPNGTTYDSFGVNNNEQLQSAISNGWYKSLMEAASLCIPDEVIDAPPTREELEQKATELEIKFDGRTNDKKLLEKIEEAMRVE